MHGERVCIWKGWSVHAWGEGVYTEVVGCACMRRGRVCIWKGGVCVHEERECVYMEGVECVCIWKGLSVRA